MHIEEFLDQIENQPWVNPRKSPKAWESLFRTIRTSLSFTAKTLSLNPEYQEILSTFCIDAYSEAVSNDNNHVNFFKIRREGREIAVWLNSLG